MIEKMNGTGRNLWCLLGSVSFFVGATGHFVVVDISWWMTGADYVKLNPADMLSQLANYEVNWGFLGKQRVLSITSGFSLWMVVSLFTIGIYNLMIFRSTAASHSLRKMAMLISSATSLLFLVLALNCMIWPAQAGGILATIFFALAFYKESSG